MLVSSILNPVTFKSLSGQYPNRENTLHADLRHGSKKVIPYEQKFPTGHTVYLQFESNAPGNVALTSYAHLTVIETVSKTYDSSYGIANARYYFNFAVVLDVDYVHPTKKVYFKAVQGSDILTSEPVLVTDLTDKIKKGRVKYVKYSNFGRVESDLSDRFIDWPSIANTGHYMDFFVEGVDFDQNDKDESEVLEGSQSASIIASTYFHGIQLKTDPVPDYMATRLAMASMVNYFEVNGLGYVKNGEAEKESFGSSTSVQCSLPLIQKYAIGSNVDSFGPSEPETPVVDPDLVVYVGIVEPITPTESEIKAMTIDTDPNKDSYLTFNNLASPKRYAIAYPAVRGPLVSILSGFTYGREIISGFTIYDTTLTIEGVAVAYKVYVLTRPTQETATTLFKFV
jgi:hypothetical protein